MWGDPRPARGWQGTGEGGRGQSKQGLFPSWELSPTACVPCGDSVGSGDRVMSPNLGTAPLSRSDRICVSLFGGCPTPVALITSVAASPTGSHRFL